MLCVICFFCVFLLLVKWDCNYMGLYFKRLKNICNMFYRFFYTRKPQWLILKCEKKLNDG